MVFNKNYIVGVLGIQILLMIFILIAIGTNIFNETKDKKPLYSDPYDIYLKGLNVERLNKSLLRPTNYFEYGLIYNYSKHDVIERIQSNKQKLKICVLTLDIFESKWAQKKLNIFNDVRLKTFKMMNFVKYLKLYNYTGIVGMKNIWNPLQFNIKTEVGMIAAYQKPFFIEKYLSEYDWIFFMDFDTIFAKTCNSSYLYSLDRIINIYSNNNNNISMIISGDSFWLNSGVFALKNTKWSKQLLNKWINITYNFDKYNISSLRPRSAWEQNIICALLQGFDPFNSTYSIYEKAQILRKLAYNNALNEGYKNLLSGTENEQFVKRIPTKFINARVTRSKWRSENESIVFHFAGGSKNLKHVRYMMPYIYQILKQC